MFQGGETVVLKSKMSEPRPIYGMVLGRCPHGVLVSWEAGWAQVRCSDARELTLVGLLELVAAAATGHKGKFTHRPPDASFKEYGRMCVCCT